MQPDVKSGFPQQNTWKLVRPLEPGGQAETFLVERAGTNKRAVLKAFKNVDWGHEKQQARRELEVMCHGRVSHTHVLPMLDHDLSAIHPYIVTEYCALGSLAAPQHRTWLNKLSPLELLHLFKQICQGMGPVHVAKIIHRDLKPGNIFIRADKTLVVGDFGVAFLKSDEHDRVTGRQEVVGARRYAAPELRDGRAADELVTPRCDIYSMGKILYWLLAGRAFDRQDHRAEAFDLTRGQTRPDYHFIYELLDRMIVLEPGERYRDASECADAVAVTIDKLTARQRVFYPSTPGSADTAYCECRVSAEGDVTETGVSDQLSSQLSAAIGAFLHHCGYSFWLSWSVESVEPGHLRMMVNAPSGWKRVEHRVGGTIRCRPVFAFDPRGRLHAALCVGGASNKSQARTGLRVLRYDGNTEWTEVAREEGVRVSRYSSLAVSSRGTIAVVSGNERVSVFDSAGVRIDAHAVPGAPASMQFGVDGDMHLAGVTDHGSCRELRYVRRSSSGTWREELVDSTDGRDAPLSGYVNLVLSVENTPLIICNASTLPNTLVVHSRESEGWRSRQVDLTPVVARFRLGQGELELGGIRYIERADADGWHLVLLLPERGLWGHALYVRLAANWTVGTSQMIAVRQLLAAGVGSDDTVHIGLAHWA